MPVRGAEPLAAVRDYDESDSQIQHKFDVIIERDSEGYYVASAPQLPGCQTQANSLDPS